MKTNKILWRTVLIVSILLLIGYAIWFLGFLKSDYNVPFSNAYNDSKEPAGFERGMMGRGYGFYEPELQYDGKEKLTIEQITEEVDRYLNAYGDTLEISEIILFRDSDYYFSVEEKATGKGAMELLVNPYSGKIYPERGPNMMWNEKYGMPGAYGMHGAFGMMDGMPWNSDYAEVSNQIDQARALIIADAYVKDEFGEAFSVIEEGHEFYGYYTFEINKGKAVTGMLSVNGENGDVWYHNWHGEIELVISHHEK